MINNYGASWEELKSDLLKDTETHKEYKELEPEYQLISEIIKARIEQKLTQKELAEKTGTKQAHISRLESGNSNPSLNFLKKIANGLGKELHITLK